VAGNADSFLPARSNRLPKPNNVFRDIVPPYVILVGLVLPSLHPLALTMVPDL